MLTCQPSFLLFQLLQAGSWWVHWATLVSSHPTAHPPPNFFWWLDSGRYWDLDLWKKRELEVPFRLQVFTRAQGSNSCKYSDSIKHVRVPWVHNSLQNLWGRAVRRWLARQVSSILGSQGTIPFKPQQIQSYLGTNAWVLTTLFSHCK